MNLKVLKEKINKIGMKNLILILGAGLLLILCSADDLGFGKSSNKSKTTQYSGQDTSSDYQDTTYGTSYEDSYKEEMENQLKNMILKMKGVEDADVMITISETREKIVLYDSQKDASESDDTTMENENITSEKKSSSSSNKESPVTVENDDVSTPYVVKEINPKIEGVAVVVKGELDINLKENIISAVGALFDVDTHKISIAEMN